MNPRSHLSTPAWAATGILVFLLLGVFTATAHAAATIQILNTDGPGEGFNDPAPFTPEGGNFAATIGQARLNAFQYAANLLGQRLNSSVTITVAAAIDPLPADAISAVLGAAGPFDMKLTTNGAAGVSYPDALANAIDNVDLDPASPEIIAFFSSTIDTGTVFGGTRWYYGFDRNAGNNIDFVSVVMHELLHGLGFALAADEATGAFLNGNPDTFLTNLEDHSEAGVFANLALAPMDSDRVAAFVDTGDLHWIGADVTANIGGLIGGTANGHMQMYSPNPLEIGSSVSHFDIAADPNELMEPFYTDPNHSPGLAVHLMTDIGWATNTGAGDADLAVSISPVDDEMLVSSGDVVDYTVTIDNPGVNTAVSSSLTFFLSAGATVNSTTPSQGSCTVFNSVVSCFLGDINSAATATVDVNTTAGPGSAIGGFFVHAVSTITSSGTPDSNQSNNIAVTTLPSTELTFAGRLQSLDSGGCTINRTASFAPLLPVLVVLSLGYLLVRRRIPVRARR